MILNDDGTYDSMSEEEMEALEQVAMHRQVNKDEDDQVFCGEDPVPYGCPACPVALRRSCHGLALARLAVLSVGWCPPPPNESGSSAKVGASLRRR